MIVRLQLEIVVAFFIIKNIVTKYYMITNDWARLRDRLQPGGAWGGQSNNHLVNHVFQKRG